MSMERDSFGSAAAFSTACTTFSSAVAVLRSSTSPDGLDFAERRLGRWLGRFRHSSGVCPRGGVGHWGCSIRFILIEFLLATAAILSIEILSIGQRMVSVRQIKAARALLAWSQKDLAAKCGLSYPTIARLESADGDIGGRTETAAKIVSALEAAGIEFTNGVEPGVKLGHPTPRGRSIRRPWQFQLASRGSRGRASHADRGAGPRNGAAFGPPASLGTGQWLRAFLALPGARTPRPDSEAAGVSSRIGDQPGVRLRKGL